MMSHPTSRGGQALAWSAHLFTASGAVAGFVSLLAIEERNWRAALIWMAVAYLIDTLDGTYSRWVRVREVLPRFDGLAVDSIVDYFTHCILPALFLYRTGLVPPSVAFLTAALVLALTPYHFGNLDVKTDDYFFQGFPGWWNLLVFYLYLFALPPWVNFVIVIVFCVLLFVPVKYVYPSRAVRLRVPMQAAIVIWLVTNAVILVQLPTPSRALVWLSLLCVVFLGGIGLARTFRPPALPKETAA
ncbi:MAG TPA: CDP-diacylglycerol O-phosphatidyltransferase [Thermoanaerobaculia bacterium]|jgi:phosphatidylcholine synthase